MCQMAEYLTGLTDEEVRTRAEGVAEHVAARLCELLEQGEFISTAQQDVEDPDMQDMVNDYFDRYANSEEILEDPAAFLDETNDLIAEARDVGILNE